MMEVYRRNAAERWELQAYQTADLVELISVGVSCAIADLYEDVALLPEDPEELED